MHDRELTMALCAYKQSPFLAAAAESLAKQTVPVKVIVATSTPSDHVKDIAGNYGWDYCVNPVSGGGIASDWEFAVSCASTPYVAIAHQDDIYFPEYAERVLAAFRRYPESQIVFTDYCDLAEGQYLRNRGYLRVKRLLLWAYYWKHSWKLGLFKRLPLCFGNAICCPSVAYHVSKIGPLRFDREFSVNLDWAKWLELSAQDGAFSYIPACLMAHRIDSTTETSAAITDHRRFDEDMRIFTKIWGKRTAKWLMRFYAKSYQMAEGQRK